MKLIVKKKLNTRLVREMGQKVLKEYESMSPQDVTTSR